MYDGDSASGSQLGSLTGESKPADVVSTGRDIFINLVSDSDQAKKGFHLQYAAGKKEFYYMLMLLI